MADIRVEGMKRGGLLPWIFGLALIALLILGLSLALGERGPLVPWGGAAETKGEPHEEPQFRQIAAFSKVSGVAA